MLALISIAIGTLSAVFWISVMQSTGVNYPLLLPYSWLPFSSLAGSITNGYIRSIHSTEQNYLLLNSKMGRIFFDFGKWRIVNYKVDSNLILMEFLHLLYKSHVAAEHTIAAPSRRQTDSQSCRLIYRHTDEQIHVILFLTIMRACGRLSGHRVRGQGRGPALNGRRESRGV